MAQTRVDSAVLDRTDPSQVQVHNTQVTWSQTNAPTVGAMQMAGNPTNGSFMMTADPLSYLAAPDGSTTMFTNGSASFSNGYQAHGQYANGSAPFDSLFDDNIGISLSLGQLPLPENGLNNMGLEMGPPLVSSSRQNGLNGFHGAPYRAAIATPAPAVVSEPKRSCCAPAATQISTDFRRHTPTSSTDSLKSSAATANTSSCCSSSSSVPMMKTESTSGSRVSVAPASISTEEEDAKVGVNGRKLSSQFSDDSMPPPAANGSGMLPPASAGQQVYPGFSRENNAPAWYKYPADYGTMAAPLQPSQWRTNLAVATTQNGFGDDELALGVLGVEPSFAMSHEMGDDAHMCACGDDCECIGCAAHPYNNATQSTIQSAWTTMMDDATNGVSKAVVSPTATTVKQHSSTDTSSPQQMQTPSDASGVTDEQDSLPAGDFLFVTYPVMGCIGEGLTCPCGDDCQCVGCTIHNNEAIESS